MNVFDLMAKLSLDKSDYEKGLSEAKGDAEKSGSSIGKGLATVASVGAKALAGATTAVTAFGAMSVKTGMEFDSAMSQVGATMGYTVAELNDETSEASKTMNQLREFAQKMGSETAFSASQSADALNYMALAGYSAEQSMEMLPTVLNLASAGGIELASASDMVTDAQSALGLSFDETAQMVDKMATTASKSNTSVAQLGEAILTVGGTAKMLSGGTTELSTALGILADNGTKGAEGGTKLRNIILSLSAPTDKAGDMMEALGVSAFDAEGNMRPLQDTIGDLNKAMDGMNDADRVNVINTIFNKADLKDVNALLDTSAERWEELSGAIDDSEGSAKAMADVQLDNLSGDITLLQSAFEGFQIAVSEGSTGALRGFVQFASESLSTLTEAYKTDGVEGAMTAIDGLISKGLDMVIEFLPKAVDAGMKLLMSLVNGITKNISKVSESAVTIIKTISTNLIQNLPTIIQSGIELVMSLVDGLASALPELIPQAVDMILTIADGLIDNIDKIVETGIKLVVSLGEGLIKALPKLVAKVPEILVKLVKAFATNAPKLFEASLKMIESLWTGLKDNLPTLLNKIPEMISNIVEALKEGAGKMIEIGSEWIESLWEGIGNKIEWIKEKISGLVGNVKSWLKKFFGGGGDEETEESTDKATAKSGSSSYGGTAKASFDSIKAVTSDSVSQSNKSVVNAINNLEKNMYSNMVDAISNGLTWEWDDRQLGRMVKNYA